MTEIGPKRFRLLFRGQLRPGASEGSAREALASELSLSPAKVNACFSGRKVALRTDMDADSVRQLHQRLTQAGLEVSIDPPLAAPASHRPTPAQPEAPARCPRCQASSAGGTVCGECRARRRRTGLRWLTGLTASTIVVALAAWGWITYGLPRLHEYQTGQHIAHALARVKQVQQPIIAVYDRSGFMPNTNLDASLPPAEELADEVVAGIRIGSSGQIILTLQPHLPLIGGDTLIFVPERHPEETLRWRCEAGTLEPARRPQSCQHKLVIARSESSSAAPLRLEDLADKMPISGGDPLTRRKAVALDEISDIIADSKSIRLKVMTYYVSAGAEWPANNDYLGLPPPNRLGGGNIQSVKVIGDGRIEYRFNDRTPGLEGHRFWLKAGAMGQWRCSTTLPDDHLPPACDSPIM